GLRLMAGDVVLMHVTDADAQLEGLPAQSLAKVYRGAIAQAIQRARDERTPEAFRAGIWQALWATLLLLLLWLLELGVSRWLDVRMERWVAAKMARLQMDPFRRETADRMLRALRTLVRGVWVIIGVVALVYWGKWVLSRFHPTRELAFHAQRWLEPWFAHL